MAFKKINNGPYFTVMLIMLSFFLSVLFIWVIGYYFCNSLFYHQYDERLMHFRPITRKEAYACDVLYGTNNEYGFDYLRDNMVPNLDDMAQRDVHFAIVDVH